MPPLAPDAGPGPPPLHEDEASPPDPHHRRAYRREHGRQGDWEREFLDMRLGSCCYSCWCPCLVYGEDAERLDGSSSIINCLLYFGLCWECLFPFAGAVRRQAMREKYHIDGE